MAIIGMTDRDEAFPQIGSIRKGAPKDPTKNRPGGDLKYFRVSFDERETVAATAFTAAYGREPTELNILFPFNEPDRCFEAWQEAYVAGGLVHRCDGQHVLYEIDPKTGERLVVGGEPETKCTRKPFSYVRTRDGGQKPVTCKPVGRMRVIIPELARLAYLVVHTTSVHDIINLSSQLRALAAVNHGRLAGIPLKLRRRPVKISTPDDENGGKRRRMVKYLLSVEADPEWVGKMVSHLKRLALPDADGTLALAAPAHTLEPAADVLGAVVATGGYGDESDPDEADGEETGSGAPEEGEFTEAPELADATLATEPAEQAAEGTSTPAVMKVRRATRDWARACKELSTRFPKYQTTVRGGEPSGQPNYFHILGAAAKCGFAEVTDDNYQIVIEAIAARAAGDVVPA